MTSLDDSYRLEPGKIAPAQLSSNRNITAPFVRDELIEDHYEQQSNRNQTGRPKFFALGWGSSLQVGKAAFYYGGSAWGGPYSALDKPLWLQNVGLGLRIFNVRSAFGNVLHLDLAKPLSRGNDIKSLQFLLKTKTSF